MKKMPPSEKHKAMEKRKMRPLKFSMLSEKGPMRDSPEHKKMFNEQCKKCGM